MVKKFIVLIVVFFCYFNPVMAESQTELNQQACTSFQKADAALNSAYQDILAKYKDDAEFIQQFTAAQKKWIEFKEAYVASRYLPVRRDSYGSVEPMCECSLLEKITTDRVKQLMEWVDGIEEGDVCLGTLRVKE